MADVPADELIDPAGVVKPPSLVGLPDGYRYGVTRYADIIFREAFPSRFLEFVEVLERFRIDVSELLTGGGSGSTMARRFDSALAERGWGKRNISVEKLIDTRPIHATRGHEIDMFASGSPDGEYPGIAIEMEWNNKDPFFDRDLLNFAALHREGALAVGVIVTRGPLFQKFAGPVIKTSASSTSMKYGQSSTHWSKLIPRINLGGGGECPLLVVGIEPQKVDGFTLVKSAYLNKEKLW